MEFASIDNMRALEQKRVFWLSGRRMLAKDRSNPNTYKVRRAKVGGYRDDFTPEQLAAIDALVASACCRASATAAKSTTPGQLATA